MRYLTREKAESWQLLERAKTIAVLGPATAPRRGTTVAYLRRVGYDVRLIRTFALANVGGPIDLVLVFGRVPDIAALLRDAATKRADGVWLTGTEPDRAAKALARELDLVMVNDADIIGRYAERFGSEAGQPPKLGVRSRRRGRPDETPREGSSRPGWTAAGGGGQRGGGGRRSAIDEKKMIRALPGPRRRRRVA